MSEYTRLHVLALLSRSMDAQGFPTNTSLAAAITLASYLETRSPLAIEGLKRDKLRSVLAGDFFFKQKE